MRVITADEIDRALTYPALIEALREAFRADIAVPLRHTHMIAQPGGSEAKLLLMPAWTSRASAFVGCKIVTVFPDNAQARQAVGLRQLPADVGRDRRAARRDGRHRADRLAHRLRVRARGVLSGARGRRASRDGRRGRARAASGARARERAADQARHAVEPDARPCRAGGVRRSRSAGSRSRSPTISKPRCARPTSSPARRSRPTPLVRGKWLKKGAHVDLVGGYTPKMREADDDAVKTRARLCRHPRRRAEGGAATSCSR